MPELTALLTTTDSMHSRLQQSITSCTIKDNNTPQPHTYLVLRSWSRILQHTSASYIPCVAILVTNLTHLSLIHTLCCDLGLESSSPSQHLSVFQGTDTTDRLLTDSEWQSPLTAMEPHCTQKTRNVLNGET